MTTAAQPPVAGRFTLPGWTVGLLALSLPDGQVQITVNDDGQGGAMDGTGGGLHGPPHKSDPPRLAVGVAGSSTSAGVNGARRSHR